MCIVSCVIYLGGCACCLFSWAHEVIQNDGWSSKKISDLLVVFHHSELPFDVAQPYPNSCDADDVGSDDRNGHLSGDLRIGNAPPDPAPIAGKTTDSIGVSLFLTLC